MGDFVLPLYPSLGLDIATFPKSPSQLAAELAAGNDSGLSAIGQDGPCGEYFTEEAAAAGADLQTYAFSIIGWVLNSTDVRSLFARPGSLTRTTRFARSLVRSLARCDTRVPWGPEVVAAVQRFNPEFVPDEA